MAKMLHSRTAAMTYPPWWEFDGINVALRSPEISVKVPHCEVGQDTHLDSNSKPSDSVSVGVAHVPTVRVSVLPTCAVPVTMGCPRLAGKPTLGTMSARIVR